MNEPPLSPLDQPLTISLRKVDEIVESAGTRVAAAMAARVPTREEINHIVIQTVKEHADEIATQAVERFLERIGLDLSDIPSLRKDFASIRSGRVVKEAVVSSGIKATVTILAGGIITAIVFYLRGAPK